MTSTTLVGETETFQTSDLYDEYSLSIKYFIDNSQSNQPLTVLSLVQVFIKHGLYRWVMCIKHFKCPHSGLM